MSLVMILQIWGNLLERKEKKMVKKEKKEIDFIFLT